MVEVHGFAADRFAPVADRFREHFATAGEVGASVCVWHQGEVVVDLWGGTMGADDPRPWQADTLVNVFSVTKGMVAAAVLWLEDQGLLDLDAPLVSVWPELAGGGRDRVTFRQVLNHTSGLVALDAPLRLDDVLAWAPVEAVLRAMTPAWEPGTAQGYHAITFGLLLRATVERAVGRSLGDILAREIAGPLGADVYIGLPEALDGRVATLVTLPLMGVPSSILVPMIVGGSLEAAFFRNVLLRPGSPGSRAVKHPRELGGFNLSNFNRPEVRRAELPWANGHASARGIARMYQALVAGGTLDGARIWSADACARPRARQSWSELDLTMRKPMGFSQGFLKEQPTMFSPSPGWFGHPGIGGSLGFADPDEGVAFGYTMNKLRPQVRSPTALALSRAVYACIGRPVAAG
jgi:CubicO group peptidase (beta-lactamase class C family)